MSPVPESNKESPGHVENVDSMDSPQFIIEAGSSDSDDHDEEDTSNQWYQPLPQEPEDVEMSDDDNDDDQAGAQAGGDVNTPHSNNFVIPDEFPSGGAGGYYVPDIPNAEAAERREVWNKSADAARLGQLQEDKIKAAMANFSLPSLNQPDWAKNISEDTWKDKLLNKIKTPSSKENVSTNANEQSEANSHGTVTTPSENFANFDAFNSSMDIKEPESS